MVRISSHISSPFAYTPHSDRDVVDFVGDWHLQIAVGTGQDIHLVVVDIVAADDIAEAVHVAAVGHGTADNVPHSHQHGIELACAQVPLVG